MKRRWIHISDAIDHKRNAVIAAVSDLSIPRRPLQHCGRAHGCSSSRVSALSFPRCPLQSNAGITMDLALAITGVIPWPFVHIKAHSSMGRMTATIALPVSGIQQCTASGHVFRDELVAGPLAPGDPTQQQPQRGRSLLRRCEGRTRQQRVVALISPTAGDLGMSLGMEQAPSLPPQHGL
jgi:hypothetical protein